MENTLQTGQPAPDFELPDILGSQKVRLSDTRGQVVILYFWSATCTWVERSDEELLPRLKEWGPGAALLAVASNANEAETELRQTALERGLPCLLHDEGHEVADLYGAQTTPHFFVIDPGGVLRYQGGFNNITFRQRVPTQAYLVPAVEAVLAGKAPDVETAPAYGCSIMRFAEE